MIYFILSAIISVPSGQPAASVSEKDGVVRVVGASLTSHVMGMTISPKPTTRQVIVDKGVFSQWKFNGTKARDTLIFGPQGTIINKRRGGVIDFGKDEVEDKFVFKNTINVAACSKKHGYQCHPLNHLQQVVIKNFGKEDVVILQGKTYTWGDLRNGAFPGVPTTRLRVEQ